MCSDGHALRRLERPPSVGESPFPERRRWGTLTDERAHSCAVGAKRRPPQGEGDRPQSPGGWRTVKPPVEREGGCQRVPAEPCPLVSKRSPATVMKTWPGFEWMVIQRPAPHRRSASGHSSRAGSRVAARPPARTTRSPSSRSPSPSTRRAHRPTCRAWWRLVRRRDDERDAARRPLGQDGAPVLIDVGPRSLSRIDPVEVVAELGELAADLGVGGDPGLPGDRPVHRRPRPPLRPLHRRTPRCRRRSPRWPSAADRSERAPRRRGSAAGGDPQVIRRPHARRGRSPRLARPRARSRDPAAAAGLRSPPYRRAGRARAVRSGGVALPLACSTRFLPVFAPFSHPRRSAPLGRCARQASGPPRAWLPAPRRPPQPDEHPVEVRRSGWSTRSGIVSRRSSRRHPGRGRARPS